MIDKKPLHRLSRVRKRASEMCHAVPSFQYGVALVQKILDNLKRLVAYIQLETPLFTLQNKNPH